MQLFTPFQKSHGRSTDCNDAPSTIDRWKTFQGKLKLLKIIDEVGLVSHDDPKKRQIPCVEHWHTIVADCCVDAPGKHLSYRHTHDVIKH
jgi:hypothetical protein